MKYIYVIIGKSGVGKDSICSLLLNDPELDLHPIVLHTTRQQRVGEVNGVNYNFVSEEEMRVLIENQLMIEHREYDTTKGKLVYGTSSTAIKDGYSYVTINTLDGLRRLREFYSNRADVVIVPIYIEVDDYTRITRSIERTNKENVPDFAECCRRYLADEEDFNKAIVEREVGRHYTVKNNGKLEDTVSRIKNTLIFAQSKINWA